MLEEVAVEVLDLGEHMACRWTSGDSTIERSLMIRVFYTNRPVFKHTLMDPVHPVTERALKTLI